MDNPYCSCKLTHGLEATRSAGILYAAFCSGTEYGLGGGAGGGACAAVQN